MRKTARCCQRARTVRRRSRRHHRHLGPGVQLRCRDGRLPRRRGAGDARLGGPPRQLLSQRTDRCAAHPRSWRRVAGHMLGSYAGAMGQPQFMPSSYLRYAVDFEGHGRRDIWTSKPDVLASIANYLAQSGWRTGESVGPAGHAAGELRSGRDGAGRTQAGRPNGPGLACGRWMAGRWPRGDARPRWCSRTGRRRGFPGVRELCCDPPL